jgi:predicted HTH transcriptional regulator
VGPRGAEFYEELIKGGERENVEFKASLRFDYKSRTANKELAKAVAKTICGFMNSDGGYLFVGISDDGQVVGIDGDLSLSAKRSVDAFLSTFYQLVSDSIGKEFSQHVHPQVIEYQGKKVCCVRTDRSERPAWLLSEVGGPSFFIRVGNSTRPLNAKEANEYVLSRFAEE